MLNLFLSILPGILIILYIYNKDQHEREPKNMIFKAVFWGGVSTIPAIYLTYAAEDFLGVGLGGNTLGVALDTIICIGGSEEIAKFFFLYLFFFRHDEFDEPLDGIVYAVCISMGFAIVENIIYVLNGGLRVALLRMFTAVPAHAAFGVIMGYFVGLAKFELAPAKNILLLQGFLLAALVHGFYDFFLMQNVLEGLVGIAFVVLGLAVFMSRRLMKLHIEHSKNRMEK